MGKRGVQDGHGERLYGSLRVIEGVTENSSLSLVHAPLKSSPQRRTSSCIPTSALGTQFYLAWGPHLELQVRPHLCPLLFQAAWGQNHVRYH